VETAAADALRVTPRPTGQQSSPRRHPSS
jgi:hypothetical protein